MERDVDTKCPRLSSIGVPASTRRRATQASSPARRRLLDDRRYFGERATRRQRCILRVLLPVAADPCECSLQVRVEACGISKGRVEDRLHEASYSLVGIHRKFTDRFQETPSNHERSTRSYKCFIGLYVKKEMAYVRHRTHLR